MANRPKRQQYRDGLLTVYLVTNAANPGAAPVEKLHRKVQLPYEERMIGVKRMYLAQQSEDRLDLLLRVPYRPGIAAQDVVIPTLDGKLYEIRTVQKVLDIRPPAMDLSLARLTADYKLEEVQDDRTG